MKGQCNDFHGFGLSGLAFGLSGAAKDLQLGPEPDVKYLRLSKQLCLMVQYLPPGRDCLSGVSDGVEMRSCRDFRVPCALNLTAIFSNRYI